MPRKPINILKTQNPKYKKILRKTLLEILMKQENPDSGKSFMSDIESDSKEIDKTFDSLRREELPLRKRMFL